MSDLRDDADLRRAFRELPAAGADDACPPAERLAASARGELDLDAERDVLDHLARCGACAAAWSAVHGDVASAASAAPSPRPRSGLPGRAGAALAAAALVVAVGAGLWWLAERPPAATGDVRRAVTPEAPVPESPLDTLGAPWELRWSAGPEGTAYDVQVTTLELDELYRALRLPGTSHRLPDDAVARIREHDAVVWQVVAHRPDGERHASRSVVVRVDP